MKKDFKEIKPWLTGAFIGAILSQLASSSDIYNRLFVLSMQVWIQCVVMILIIYMIHKQEKND